MRRTTKRLVPAKPEHEVTDSEILCDLCGADVDYNDNPRIEITRRESYPYNDSPDVTRFDCCGACFDAKVSPALIALGFTPREDS
jgi:hypothetical protein